MRSPQLTARAGVVATAAALTAALLPGGTVAAHAAGSGSADAQVPVALKVADQPTKQVAVAPESWPGEVLEQHGVGVDGNDLVTVVRGDRRVTKGGARRLRPGDKLKVVVVDRSTVARTVRVAPRTVVVPTTSLKPGRREVANPGRPGVRRVKVARTLHNGAVVDSRVVDRRTVRAAKPKRVLVGRRATSVPAADGLNWGALAGCESGGNPRAVNAAGYYGLYQFNVGTWNSVGGSGMPHHASPAEQTYRAKLLYKSRGRSPWPNCGRLL